LILNVALFSDGEGLVGPAPWSWSRQRRANLHHTLVVMTFIVASGLTGVVQFWLAMAMVLPDCLSGEFFHAFTQLSR
jgi:hypothetical protein